MKRSGANQKRAPKKKFCLESECKSLAQTVGYCRLHYIANWRTLKFDEKARAERRLNAYVEGMSKRFPKDYMERIREGLESEDKFKETMDSLNLEPDESNTSETEREFVERIRRTFKIED